MAVYERRYVLCAVEAAEALRALGSRLVREVFDRERPLSFTRTVYLDTGDLEYLRSSYRPVARRLRVRQYASARGLFDIPLFTSPVYLELKESCGATRLKRRISMAPRLLPGISPTPHWARPEQAAAARSALGWATGPIRTA